MELPSLGMWLEPSLGQNEACRKECGTGAVDLFIGALIDRLCVLRLRWLFFLQWKHILNHVAILHRTVVPLYNLCITA